MRSEGDNVNAWDSLKVEMPEVLFKSFTVYGRILFLSPLGKEKLFVTAELGVTTSCSTGVEP
jgi:hypothetical protein